MSWGVCVVRQAPVICVMVPPIHLGAWSMALMLWLPFELLLLLLLLQTCKCGFDIRVVLCTSVPSVIVRNANPTKLWP